VIFRVVIALLLFVFVAGRIVWYEALSLALTLYFLLDLIGSIGKKIPFLEVVIVFVSLTCLAMPVVAYEIFNEYHELSELWVTFMAAPAPDYFSYALPATIAFAAGLKMPLMRNSWTMLRYKDSLSAYLSNKSYLGLYLIATGFAATFLVKIAPGAIKNIVQNFALLTYVGMFYVIYSPFRYKVRVVLICLGMTVSQSIASGMYGELVYMSVISSLILLAGKNIRMSRKLLVVASGVFLIFFIQSIKFEYRLGTWSGLERSADPALFRQLVWQRLSNPSEIFEAERVFNLSVRANQGNIISKVINYVPKFEPFARGRTILEAAAAAVAPRFLWPNKPKSGGADMVCRYLGDCDSALRGLSYNVGPLGEAYINFGRGGGIAFMFFYGLFFNFLLKQTLLIAQKKPSLILWFPLLFISFFTMENDVLSFLNSFVKSAFFTFVMFKAAKLLFRISL
jgi:hypothetical protein